mmetsp:Transcript_100152/g.298916  ORF Transcript_100152/g.298916 Transcript_100152/m.298916 type:complete len:232 (-) Transcript_100152:348-1043(-)
MAAGVLEDAIQRRQVPAGARADRRCVARPRHRRGRPRATAHDDAQAHEPVWEGVGAEGAGPHPAGPPVDAAAGRPQSAADQVHPLGEEKEHAGVAQMVVEPLQWLCRGAGGDAGGQGAEQCAHQQGAVPGALPGYGCQGAGGRGVPRTLRARVPRGLRAVGRAVGEEQARGGHPGSPAHLSHEAARRRPSRREAAHIASGGLQRDDDLPPADGRRERLLDVPDMHTRCDVW